MSHRNPIMTALCPTIENEMGPIAGVGFIKIIKNFEILFRLFLSSFGTIPISILIYIWFEMVASFFMLGVFTRDYRLYWNHLPYFVTEKKKTRFAIFLFFFALCGQIIVSFFVFGMANLRQELDMNYCLVVN